MLNCKKFVEDAEIFLESYINKNDLKSIVCGISGGIDSTVSAVIASNVCKKVGIPFIGRSLPCTTNKKEETVSANLVGKAFCDDFKEVSISEECQKLIYELELNEGDMSRLQEGNIKARVRMIYLRHLASIHSGIVLDNDNFTEWNLGFWTVGGDSPMDLNIGLHYLWKTEVYELAEYLKEYYRVGYIESKNNPDDEVEITDDWFNKYEAIRDSINLTPTDGNGVSASDCEQFDLKDYWEVDDVLKTMFFNHKKTFGFVPYDNNPEYLRLVNSYGKTGVDKVILLHKKTGFKRENFPITPTFKIER
jgi:NAD+ synthetase